MWWCAFFMMVSIRRLRWILGRVLLGIIPRTYRIHVLYHMKNQRLDSYLHRVIPSLTRGAVRELIRRRKIRVNGRRVDVRCRVRMNDTVDFHRVDESCRPRFVPHDLDLDIVFQDESLIVVNKQAGVLVHPGYDLNRPSLLAGLVARGLIDQPSPFVFDHMVAHRLDMGTTGLLVFARTRQALRSLRQQFRRRTIRKEYLTVVSGVVVPSRGSIDQPIRKPVGSRAREVAEDGKRSLTGYEAIEQKRDYSLLRVTLHTGRTHQIRVHLRWLGYPVVGDSLYCGESADGVAHQLLHSAVLGFRHPRGSRWVELRAEPPQDFRAFWESVR